MKNELLGEPDNILTGFEWLNAALLSMGSLEMDFLVIVSITFLAILFCFRRQALDSISLCLYSTTNLMVQAFDDLCEFLSRGSEEGLVMGYVYDSADNKHCSERAYHEEVAFCHRDLEGHCFSNEIEYSNKNIFH